MYKQLIYKRIILKHLKLNQKDLTLNNIQINVISLFLNLKWEKEPLKQIYEWYLYKQNYYKNLLNSQIELVYPEECSKPILYLIARDLKFFNGNYLEWVKAICKYKKFIAYYDIEGKLAYGNEQIAKKNNYLNKIVTIIKTWNPNELAKNFKKERDYQIGLASIINEKLEKNKIKIEQQEGDSRPDILINVGNFKIAIEIKGPTTHSGLNSLEEKCKKYLKKYDILIIVLFDLENVREIYYKEIVRNLKNKYPQIVIIRKDLKNRS